jgi:hypothetical protein
MEPADSLQSLYEHTTDHYSSQINPVHNLPSNNFKSFSVAITHLSLSQTAFFLQASSLQPCKHFSSTQWMSHATYIELFFILS